MSQKNFELPDTGQKHFEFTDMGQVKNSIIDAIEYTGVARGDDFDIDAIAADCFTYGERKISISSGHLQTRYAGWEQTATTLEFWQSVQTHAKSED